MDLSCTEKWKIGVAIILFDLYDQVVAFIPESFRPYFKKASIKESKEFVSLKAFPDFRSGYL